MTHTSSLQKCPHGIFDPDGTGVARYCGICTFIPLADDEPIVKRRATGYKKENLQRAYQQWCDNPFEPAWSLYTELFELSHRLARDFDPSDMGFIEDAIEDVATHTWEATISGKFTSGAEYATWAHRVIRNKFLDAIRSKRHTESLNDPDYSLPKEHETSSAPSPEDKVLLKEILETLDSGERELFDLKACGYTTAEIAERLSATHSSIERRWTDLLAKVKKP